MTEVRITEDDFPEFSERPVSDLFDYTGRVPHDWNSAKSIHPLVELAGGEESFKAFMILLAQRLMGNAQVAVDALVAGDYEAAYIAFNDTQTISMVRDNDIDALIHHFLRMQVGADVSFVSSPRTLRMDHEKALNEKGVPLAALNCEQGRALLVETMESLRDHEL